MLFSDYIALMLRGLDPWKHAVLLNKGPFKDSFLSSRKRIAFSINKG